MQKTQRLQKPNRNWLIWLSLFAIFCYLVLLLRSVLMPFVAGIILGYLLDPIATKIQKLGMNRTLATCVIMLIAIVFLVPVIIFVISSINEQISNFIVGFPDLISNLIKKIEPILIELQDRFPNISAQRVKEYLQSNAANSLKIAGTVAKKVVSSGFAIINIISLLLITPIVAFYMLRDWKKFLSKVDSLLPRESKQSIRKIAKEIDRTIAGFIRGQLSVCVILGTFYSLGLYFIGVQFGLLIGFIAGLISFIPYIGSITGFVVSIAVAYIQFDTFNPVLYVIILFAIGQFVESNFLTPKLVGDSVGLHPVWVMFALLSGGVLLGFLGLMLAVPIAAIIGVLIRHNIENYKKSSLYLGD